jgi:hypothetical protein
MGEMGGREGARLHISLPFSLPYSLKYCKKIYAPVPPPPIIKINTLYICSKHSNQTLNQDLEH